MSQRLIPAITGLLISLIICCVIYFTGRFLLIEYDHKQVEEALEQFALVYGASGSEGIEQYVDNYAHLQSFPLVRIYTDLNETLYFHSPHEWKSSEKENLNRIGSRDERICIVSLASGEEIEVLKHHLADGLYLQLGVYVSILENRLILLGLGCIVLFFVLALVFKKMPFLGRVSIWYGQVNNTLLFGLMLRTGVVFLIALLLIATAVMLIVPPIVQNLDREEIQSIALEGEQVLKGGGDEEFRAWMHEFGREDFFIRLSGPKNETLGSSYTAIWEELGVEEAVNQRQQDKWLILENEIDRGDILRTQIDGDWVLQVGDIVTPSSEIHLPLFFAIVAIFLPALVIGLVGSYVLSKRSIRPIADMIQLLEHVMQTGDLSRRLSSEGGSYELGQMIGLFNGMQDRINGLMLQLQQTLDHVAHDLRTPLTRLRGKAELALHGKSNINIYAEALAGSVEETEYVLNMLNVIMDVAEAESGAMKISRTPHDLKELLDKVVDLYSFVAEEKKIVLKLTAENTLLVPLDEIRIQQAVANLIDNAIKYTPEGGRVYVDILTVPEYAKIVVSDTGIGISDEHKPHVWDRLYRVDSSRSAPGMGLGLSLVKAIAHAHNGHVGVESNEYGGTDFSISIPI